MSARHIPALLVAVILTIVLPGVWFDIGTYVQAPGAPPTDPSPALDAFLASANAVLPPRAQLLVAANPPAIVYYRATYALYPRRVYTAFPIDYAHSNAAPSTTWTQLRRQALSDGARYVLLWNQSGPVRGAVMRRQGAGLLVEVR